LRELIKTKLGGDNIAKTDGDHEAPSANRKIKDGVFKLLFEKPENTAELYYALTGEKCDSDEIEIITLSTVISGKQKNDLAFVVRDKIMVISEHQSTANPNLPLRILMYYGQLCEKWIKMKREEDFIYRESLQKIPTPQFVVFYNGTKSKPAKEILKLSDSYEFEQIKDFGFLELEVPVYNINKEIGVKLFERSEKLKQYAEFIAEIRANQNEHGDFTRAVKEAVKKCINNGILEEFLRKMGGEVMNVMFEYDEETAKKYYIGGELEKIIRRMMDNNYTIDSISDIIGISQSKITQILERGIYES
jgi:hypothetical protein